MFQLFFDDACLPMTDELIADLVADGGWDRQLLLKLRDEGYVYSLSRGSLLSPVESG
jgi:hypothetical protein